jgi:hypothetical protein
MGMMSGRKKPNSNSPNINDIHKSHYYVEHLRIRRDAILMSQIMVTFQQTMYKGRISRRLSKILRVHRPVARP